MRYHFIVRNCLVRSPDWISKSNNLDTHAPFKATSIFGFNEAEVGDFDSPIN
jgi:hypothetical protein